MLGLTNLGFIHTLIGVFAIVVGIAALVRDREILPRQHLGGVYVAATALTAATGLGIFQHGGFGPPHVLSILTLLTLAIGLWIAFKTPFGRLSRYLQAVCFSITFLFHAIPGFTESLVRLPVGRPLMSGPDDPAFKPLYGTLFLLCFIGLALQARWIRGRSRDAATALPDDARVAS